ncbi:MAG: glycosyltransferase, partial [SAR324 cluster bacterium]|nr:glycosyltransferase [SAR324 cluster bacterium]
MKIAHLSFSFLPQIGGAEIFVHNLALQQEQAGHQVLVICGWNYWREIKGAIHYTVRPLLPKTLPVISKVRKHGYDTRWLVNAQIAFYQLIYRFDMWHIHMAHPAGVGAVFMLKAMRVPTLLSSYGGDIQTLPEIDYGNRLNPEVEKDL